MSTVAGRWIVREHRGVHGLPLMGNFGDWNDGMNRVGREGVAKASGWGFSCTRRSASSSRSAASTATIAAPALRYVPPRSGQALNQQGWDGDWYRRAWYDDGTILGSATGSDGQIDALVQAWVL